MRIESIIRDNVDPRIQGLGIVKVGSFSRGPVVIVRVPRSWTAPHMVSLGSQSHFYSRNSAGKYPLDVREIRASFLRGTQLGESIKRFREARLSTIVAGETPVPLALVTEPLLVIHVVPLSSTDDRGFDVAALRQRTAQMKPPRGGSSWDHRFNLDGFVTFAAQSGGTHRSYLQAFRDGAFEGAARIGVNNGGPPPHLNAIAIEKTVRDTVSTCAALLRELGIAAPLSILISLLDAKGMWIPHNDPGGPLQPMLIDRTPLLLPDVVLEDEMTNVSRALRPLFDALWQASGWDRSYGYDATGGWSDSAHR